MDEQSRRVLLTLGLGFVGATGAVALGLPAGALIGAAIVVSAAAGFGWRLEMPVTLRNVGFAMIGLSLGSGVGPEALTQIGGWTVSLVILSLSIVVTLLVAAWTLQCFVPLDRDTAMLSASPGTLSYVLAIALEARADETTVLILQSLRLLLLATILPISVVLLGAAPDVSAPVEVMGPGALVVLFLITLVLGWSGTRAGLPTAYMIAGLVTSGAAHATALTVGMPYPLLVFAGFAITGTTIGSRFSGISLVALRRLVGAAVLTVALATGISAGFAAITHSLTGLPFGQTWIAYAPGGVEAMAVIGLALGYDPAFIALHHLVRIGLLIVILPLAMRVAR